MPRAAISCSSVTAAPARSAAGRAVLQVEIAHRQADHRDAGSGDEVQRAQRLVRLLRGERAAVPAEDPAGEAVAERRLRDVAKRPRRRIEGLVDVQIEIEAARAGEREQAIQLAIDRRVHVGHRAEDAALARDQVRERVAEAVLQVLEVGERDRLERDPVPPRFAQLREHLPRGALQRPRAVEMGADRDRAVGEGAAQAELEARPQVRSAPMGAAVALDGRDGGREAAVRIRGARPDVALVEMGVDVDQPGPDLPAVLAEGSALGSLPLRLPPG